MWGRSCGRLWWETRSRRSPADACLFSGGVLVLVHDAAYTVGLRCCATLEGLRRACTFEDMSPFGYTVPGCCPVNYSITNPDRSHFAFHVCSSIHQGTTAGCMYCMLRETELQAAPRVCPQFDVLTHSFSLHATVKHNLCATLKRALSRTTSRACCGPSIMILGWCMTA